MILPAPSSWWLTLLEIVVWGPVALFMVVVGLGWFLDSWREPQDWDT